MQDNSAQFLQKYLNDYDHDDRVMLLDDMHMFMCGDITTQEFCERYPNVEHVAYIELFYELMQEALINYNERHGGR